MTDATAIALFTSIPTTIVAISTLIVAIKSVQKTKAAEVNVIAKVEEVHKATNSIVDRLVATTKLEALARGVKEGKEEEKANPT